MGNPRAWRIFSASAVTAFVLFATGGCKPASEPALRLSPKGPPPGIWTEETIENGWITVDVGLPHDGTPPHPVVLAPTVADHRLLARGIGVVRWKTNWELLRGLAAKPRKSEEPATQDDSEGVGLWLLRAKRPGLVGRAYFQIITQEASKTVPRVLDYLETFPDVDPKRIAISGSSTGGFTALQAMAGDSRIAVGTVQVACGEYRIFLRSSSLALADRSEWLSGGRLVLDEDYAAEIEAIEPVNHADSFPPRPLLLISGAEDRAIPRACVAATAERLEAAYRNAGAPDRFTWVELAGVGHNVGEAGERRVLDFLERWLVPTRLGATEPREVRAP